MEDLAEVGNGPPEDGFDDEFAVPDALEQFVLADHAARVRRQEDEEIDQFGPDVTGVARARDAAKRRLDEPIPDLEVVGIRSVSHRPDYMLRPALGRRPEQTAPDAAVAGRSGAEGVQCLSLSAGPIPPSVAEAFGGNVMNYFSFLPYLSAPSYTAVRAGAST